MAFVDSPLMVSSLQRPILGLNVEELSRVLEGWGEPKYRTAQLLSWLYQTGVSSFAEMTNLSHGLRNRLEDGFSLPQPKVKIETSEDGTRKYGFCLEDGALVESVWIPEKERATLCLSSQVGCPLKCAFCVTGAIGYTRNLTVEEILLQLRYVKLVEGRRVTNLVFMGMGEPLLNPENVAAAIKQMVSSRTFGLGKRKITVSTAGLVPQLLPFFNQTKVKVAISLTGVTNRARDHWMPINQRYPLEVLIRELKKISQPKGQRISFEVVVIAGETDHEIQAKELARLLQGVSAKVNLVPYNENRFFPELKTPDIKRVDRFGEVLRRQGIFTAVRKSRGGDIMAACGQLAGTESENEEQNRRI